MCREFRDSREAFSADERAAYEAEYAEYLDACEDRYYDDATESEYEFGDDDSMDGDFDSGMASAGFGTDEDYGYYEQDADCWG